MILKHEEDYISQWSAISSIAPKTGCTCETLRRGVRQTERDQGVREGQTTSEKRRIITGLFIAVGYCGRNSKG